MFKPLGMLPHTHTAFLQQVCMVLKHHVHIGGDYDRLPQPFLGGTPGMFGGPLGGGHGFGGQGPPAPFFLGGSRSSRGARAAGSFRLH